jgi:hypothetical protein
LRKTRAAPASRAALGTTPKNIKKIPSHPSRDVALRLCGAGRAFIAVGISRSPKNKRLPDKSLPYSADCAINATAGTQERTSRGRAKS